MWLNLLLFFLNGLYIINFKQLHYGWYDPLILIFSSFLSLFMGLIGKICHQSFTNGFLLAYIINCELSFYIKNFKLYLLICFTISFFLNYLLKKLS